MTAWTNDEPEKNQRSGRAAARIPPGRRHLAKAGHDLGREPQRGPARQSLQRTASPWFRAIQARREGQIQAGGMQKDVAFVDPDQSIGDALDAEYRS